MRVPFVFRRRGLAATIVCSVIWASAAQAVPQTAPTAGARPTEGEIELFQSEARVLVMMQIGEGELAPMVFDTGSDGHSIDQSLVARHQLAQVGEVIAVDGSTGNAQHLAMVALPDVSLGRLRVGSIEAAALDYDRTDAMGIISSEMFEGSLVVLELDRNRVRLLPLATTTPPEGPGVPYVADIATIDLVMPDGSTLPAHFDTGYNAALSLPIALMDTVPLMAPATVVGRFKSINTEGEVYGGQIRGVIRIGPVTLENPHVAFLGDLANIGLPVIRQITLVMDPEHDRSWVVAPGSWPARD